MSDTTIETFAQNSRRGEPSEKPSSLTSRRDAVAHSGGSPRLSSAAVTVFPYPDRIEIRDGAGRLLHYSQPMDYNPFEGYVAHAHVVKEFGPPRAGGAGGRSCARSTCTPGEVTFSGNGVEFAPPMSYQFATPAERERAWKQMREQRGVITIPAEIFGNVAPRVPKPRPRRRTRMYLLAALYSFLLAGILGFNLIQLACFAGLVELATFAWVMR